MVSNVNVEGYDIPILFVCFNRLEIAKKSFEKIVQIKPKKIYIACDGAREFKTGEKEKVFQVRKEILKLITWECEIKTLFQEKNLGCSKGVYTAISWLFSYENMGIILEDDCIPNKSFFIFMKEMLNRYKDDQRIAMISGFNPHMKNQEKEVSYYFSKFKSCWGWGTWKRAWKNMDLNLECLNTKYKEDIILNMGYDKKFTIKYWNYRLKLVKLKEVSAWDWQWYISTSSQSQFTIYPIKNLVSNIGFGSEATHTNSKMLLEYILTEELEFPLKHPLYMVPDHELEEIIEKSNISIKEKIKWIIPIKLKNIIKKIIR